MTETDATNRPLQVPPQFIPYLDNHRVYSMLKDLLRELLVEQPHDPLRFLKLCLSRHLDLSGDIDNVMVLVSPDLIKIDKKQLVRDIIKELGYIVVTRRLVLDKYEKHKRYVPKCISISLLAEVTKQIVLKEPVKHSGWIMFDHPCTVDEAECMQQEGILPNITLVLLPKPKEEFRAPNAWTHSRSFWIQDFEGLRAAYKATVKEIYIDDDEDEAKIVNRCFNGIRACKSGAQHAGQGFNTVGAPGTYRVLLIGPTGSGRKTQAKLLAKHFDLIYLEWSYLLREANAREDEIAKQLKKFGPSLNLKAEIVNRRLLMKDCLSQGWVLTGYPANGKDFEKLELMTRPPNRIIFISVDLKTSKERMLLRFVDTCTGKLVSHAGPGLVALSPDAEKEADNELELYYTEILPDMRAAAGMAAEEISGVGTIGYLNFFKGSLLSISYLRYILGSIGKY